VIGLRTPKFSGPKRRLESLATIEPGIQSMPESSVA